MRDNSEQETEVYKKRCEICGQWFDTRDVDQVFHHDGKPHEALPPSDR